MKRDMLKTVADATGKIPGNYDMTVGELESLYQMIKQNEIFEALSTAFKYGFILGSQSEREKQR